MVELELDDFKSADFQKEFQSACEVRKLGRRLGGVRLHTWVQVFTPKAFYLVAQFFILSFEHNHTPRCSQEVQVLS